jgi:hypothetical protein
MLGGLAPARLLFAAGAVMVAVFLMFALSGPLPADGDGDHPRHRGAARRALLVRLMLVPIPLPSPAGPPVSAEVARQARPRTCASALTRSA